jgi:hypothetical protein
MIQKNLKNIGILAGFSAIFAAIIVYFPIGVFLFAPLSFLKGYLIQEERASGRALFLLLNFILLFATVVSLIFVVKPASLMEGTDDELTFFFILWIFLYQFFDVIIFWIGMNVRNRKTNKLNSNKN